jgi:hypothetical protein
MDNDEINDIYENEKYLIRENTNKVGLRRRNAAWKSIDRIIENQLRQSITNFINILIEMPPSHQKNIIVGILIVVVISSFINRLVMYRSLLSLRNEIPESD